MNNSSLCYSLFNEILEVRTFRAQRIQSLGMPSFRAFWMSSLRFVCRRTSTLALSLIHQPCPCQMEEQQLWFVKHEDVCFRSGERRVTSLSIMWQCLFKWHASVQSLASVTSLLSRPLNHIASSSRITLSRMILKETPCETVPLSCQSLLPFSCQFLSRSSACNRP